MSDRKEDHLGELLIQSRLVQEQERSSSDHRNVTHREELDTIKHNRQHPQNWDKDTLAPDIAFPQGVLPTAPSKLEYISKSQANYRTQSVRTAPKSKFVNTQFPNDNTSIATDLLSSSNTSPPVTVKNPETFSRRDVSLKYIEDENITQPFSLHSFPSTLINGERNLTIDSRDQLPNTQSSNGHMTNLQALAVEKSFMYSTVIDIPPETGRYNAPKLTISPICLVYSSTDIHEENICQEASRKQDSGYTTSQNFGEKKSINSDIEPCFYDAQQRISSYQAEPMGVVSDRRHHPEWSESVKSMDQGKRLQLEAKLNNLHLKSLQSKSVGYEKRSKLRYSRAEMSIADEDFMRHVREERVLSSPVNSALEASFERLQAARKEYGSLEELYNDHEESLDREEFKITRIQNQILSGAQPSQDGDNDIGSLSSSSEEGSEDLEGIYMQKPYHPLYEEYLSRFGDLNLCLEEHLNLVSEYDALLKQQETYKKHGIPVHPQTEIILARFPSAESKILDRLKEIEADVNRLMRACIQEGLLSQGGDQECVGESEENDILMSPNGSPSFQQSEYQKYSLLLEQPNRKMNEERSNTLNTVLNQDDVGDRIMRWLLHKLRSSCLEVELLARYSEGHGPIVDTEKWQQDVLEFWFIDDANLPVSAYKIEPTLTTFTPSSISDLNRVVLMRFGNKEHIQLIIRSSSLSRKFEFERWLRLARMNGRSAMSVL